MATRICGGLKGMMVALPNVCTDARDMMFKTKDVLSSDFGDLGKSKGASPRIWPLSRRRINEKEGERLRLHEFARFGPPRTRSFLRNTLSDHCTIADSNDPESFHRAIGPILSVAQFFGVLPVAGIRSPSPAKLSFKKFSFHTAYAASITMMILVMAALSVAHMIRTLNSETLQVSGGIGAATAGAIFYGNSLLGTILFFWLSPRWVTLQQNWRAMERYIDSNKAERPTLRWKFRILSTVVLILALVEHLLSIAVNAVDYDWSGSENSTFRNFLRIYSFASHAFIMDSLEYNFALGIFIFVISKIATFTWNFTDLFVMLISTGVAERYKALNKKVSTAVNKRRGSIDWCEFREDFAALSSMVKQVDDDISPIILLSFANNLYFICLQLLNGLSRPADSTMLSAVYFFGSFVFLIGRTVAVTLLAARINDQSKVALPALYNCSASNYTIETQRLQHQLTTDDIALTGLRFFSITRNFMLAVAGAIITYEVVLLQFNVAMNK